MTKQIQEYMAYITAFMKDTHTDEELIRERGLLLKRIELYQHERLIHLLVTLAFAIFFLFSLYMLLTVGGAGIFALTLLFFILLKKYCLCNNISVTILFTPSIEGFDTIHFTSKLASLTNE